jgi:exodeoxyribonuclease V alpha subunit
VGTVVAADGDCIHVMFEDSEEWLKYEEYKDEELFELDLAYATTIHKSQGSEYDIVVVVLMKSASIMLQRNLLYTAVTRAKDVCIIVGQKQAIYTSIAEWRMIPRQTRLKERL